MLKPLSNNIVVEILQEDDTTSSSGIILLSKNKEAELKGKVLAIGSKVSFIQVGDVVLFPSYAGIEIKHEKEDYLILKELDVLAVIN